MGYCGGVKMTQRIWRSYLSSVERQSKTLLKDTFATIDDNA